MALTVEPGIYVRRADDVPAAYHDIGIRIEDDALVTDDGCEILTGDVPKFRLSFPEGTTPPPDPMREAVRGLRIGASTVSIVELLRNDWGVVADDRRPDGHESEGRAADRRRTGLHRADQRRPVVSSVGAPQLGTGAVVRRELAGTRTTPVSVSAPTM